MRFPEVEEVGMKLITAGTPRPAVVTNGYIEGAVRVGPVGGVHSRFTVYVESSMRFA